MPCPSLKKRVQRSAIHSLSFPPPPASTVPRPAKAHPSHFAQIEKTEHQHHQNIPTPALNLERGSRRRAGSIAARIVSWGRSIRAAWPRIPWESCCIGPSLIRVWSDKFYIGAGQTAEYPISGEIFADNLPVPQPFTLTVSADVKHTALTLDELRKM